MKMGVEEEDGMGVDGRKGTEDGGKGMMKKG